ncbi:MAG: MarR family transcriptional regulator [Spirochaetales bacterium]|nr:MarR family transcriptional regulator [Spirochaetales bacterium]
MDKDQIFYATAAFISDIHNLEQSLSTLVERDELTPLQHNLMRILYFSTPKTLSSLSECMNMNMPNTSREVKKLTQINLVHKSQGADDRRIVELSLTEEGKSKVEKSLEQMKNAFFKRKKEWSDEDQRKFLDSLTIVSEELF